MNKSLPPCRFFMVERTVSTERREAAKKRRGVRFDDEYGKVAGDSAVL